MDGEPGYIYVIKFERPVGNPARKHGSASTYCGWAKNVEGRFYYHLAGKGASLTRAAVQQGIGMELVLVIPGTRADERTVKNGKNIRRFLAKHGVTL